MFMASFSPRDSLLLVAFHASGTTSSSPFFRWLPQSAASHNALGTSSSNSSFLCDSFKFVESMSPILDCFRQVHHNHFVCFGTLLRDFCGWRDVGWWFMRVCGWENFWSGAHQKPQSNQLTPNMFENLGRPADLENQGRFFLMLQPLGLVVSWAKANKPSCWHVLA